jgi:hypothetical protein
MRLTHLITSVFVGVFISIFTLISCGPDLDGIQLSECMKNCNTTVKQCLEKSNAHLDSCSLDDKECQKFSISETELCLTTCLDCIATCASDVEKQLKK